MTALLLGIALPGGSRAGPPDAAIQEEHRLRVVLLPLSGARQRRDARRTRRLLQRVIRSRTALRLVPLGTLTRQARQQMLPDARWRPPGPRGAFSRWLSRSREDLGRLGSSMKLALLLVVEVRPPRRAARVRITALDGRTAGELGTTTVNLRRGRLRRAAAEKLGSFIETQARRASKGPLLVEPAWAPGPSSTPRRSAAPAARDADQPEGRRAPATQTTPPARSGGQWAAAEQGWSAIEDASPPQEKASASPLEEVRRSGLKLSSRVTVEHLTYFRQPAEERAAGRNAVDFRLQAQVKTRHLISLGRFWARHDFSNPERDRLEAEEAYLGFEAGPLSLRAGKMIVAWGTTNMLNVADVVNAKDLRDPLDQQTLGSWMVRLRFIAGPLSLEGFYLPIPEGHLLPLPSGFSPAGVPLGPWRWMGAGVAVDGELPLAIDFEDPAPAIPDLKHTQLALRAGLSLPAVDISLGYTWRFDLMPSLRVAQQVDDPVHPTVVNMSVRTERPRVHAWTIEFETTLKSIRIAAEALAVLTSDPDDEDPQVPNPYVTAVVGADYRTGPLIGDHHLHFFLDILASRTLVGTQPQDLLQRYRLPFAWAALSRVRYEWGADLRLDLDVVSSLERYDLMISPSAQYTLFDHLVIKAGVELFMGDRDQGFWGPFSENSRFSLKLEANL